MSSKTSPKWNSLGDFLKAKEERDKEEQQKAPQPESQQSEPSPTTPNHPQPPTVIATPSPAPLRDFNRRANSIERQALPQGLFPGSSKKLWDAVYFRTRGAIQPIMEIRATKRDLLMWSGIRNIKTIEAHLRYFLATGMMMRSGENGDPAGYSYGVVMLEEIPIPTPTIPNQHGDAPSNTLPNQKTVMGGDQKTVMVGEGNPVENKDTYGFAKTSFKTSTERTDDDEAAPVLHALRKMIEEITGREATRGEYSKLVELIEVLTLEGKIAAARTTVSSAGPFLAEHLRRRLFKKNKQELAIESAQSEPSPPSINANECPDCAGVGWYYPEGKEKGMAKCRHPKLTDTPDSSD